MSRGRLTVVGIGPGSPQDMTLRARDAVAASDTVVGYTTYVKLVADMVSGKDVISTGMMKEADTSS